MPHTIRRYLEIILELVTETQQIIHRRRIIIGRAMAQIILAIQNVIYRKRHLGILVRSVAGTPGSQEIWLGGIGRSSGRIHYTAAQI